MKAKVKATGEIIDVYESYVEDFPWTDEMGDKIWKTEELMFLETADNTPDYWTRLEHQYAGMAMQAMLTSPELMQVVTSAKELLTDEFAKRVAVVADRYAHALVEKMKEERK